MSSDMDGPDIPNPKKGAGWYNPGDKRYFEFDGREWRHVANVSSLTKAQIAIYESDFGTLYPPGKEARFPRSLWLRVWAWWKLRKVWRGGKKVGDL